MTSTTRGDPGLQPERTTLARRRTALSAVGLGLAFIRLGLEGRGAAEVLAGLAALATALALTARAARADTPSSYPVTATAAALTALCSIVLGLLLHPS